MYLYMYSIYDRVNDKGPSSNWQEKITLFIYFPGEDAGLLASDGPFLTAGINTLLPLHQSQPLNLL